MPLKRGTSKSVVSKNIKEFHSGNTYAATMKKFGKAKADKQAIAVAFSEKRKAGPRAMAKKRKKKKSY
jgi:hypothetical protein